MKPTIEEIKSRLEQLTPGYRAHVQLLPKAGRKKAKNAPTTWTPESGEIRITFEPAKPSPQATPQSNPIYDLLRSLNRAESTPGYDFVSLKWFRDVVLPAEGFEWAESVTARQAVLREAIEKRLVLTSKFQNPKSPQFPVTGIRINRLLRATQAILGAEVELDSGFDPVAIPGEELSATVLRERR